MTEGLACSAGDLTHHLPPGAPCLKTIESFTSPLLAVGCGLAAAQQNPTLIYVGDLAQVANIKTQNSRISSRLENNKICVSFEPVKQCVHVGGGFQSYLHCRLLWEL